MFIPCGDDVLAVTENFSENLFSQTQTNPPAHAAHQWDIKQVGLPILLRN